MKSFRKVRAAGRTLKMLILGNKTAQTSGDAIHYLLFVGGQSQIVASDRVSNLTDDVNWFSDRVKYWDKLKRQNYKLPETSDSARGGEAHRFREYDEFSAGNGAIDPYPWESTPLDPIIAPDQVAASNWCRHRKGQLRIVKLAESGSQIAISPAVPSWNVNETGSASYLETFKNAYCTPAINQAIEDAGGAGNVRILGVVWFQGFGDARNESDALAFEDNTGDFIDDIRAFLKPSDPTSVSFLEIQSPLTIDQETQDPAGYIETIRAAQANMGNRANVTVLDSEGLPIQGDGLHITSDGCRILGDQIARHFRALDGVELD